MAADIHAIAAQGTAGQNLSSETPGIESQPTTRVKEFIERRRGWVLLLIISLGFGIRLTGLFWGQGYCYFAQGDGVEAYSVAVNYGNGETRAQYLGQPNYNEQSKLPGPLWTMFCYLGLRLGRSISGIIAAIILLNTAAIYLTYKLANVTVGFPASLWAALFCATQPWAVFYSVLVYNPDVMPFLAGLIFLALWKVIQEAESRKIFWVCLLLMIMPQFHMSGLMLVPATVIILLLSNVRLNVPWLVAGLITGGLMYIPYLRGEMAHGWQNTLGMFSGRERHSWEGLKALSAPLSFLVSWAPRWTRSTSEYRELGEACFGSFGMFLAFSFVSAVVALFLLAEVFLKIKTALNGFLQSPRQTFRRSSGVLFLFVLVAVPIAFALISRNPFHTRYCLVYLPALFSLVSCAVERVLSMRRAGPILAGALFVTTAGNVWFLPAMYHYQGMRIENGPSFIPSFRQLEKVYQQLKRDAESNQCIEVVVDKAHVRALPEDTLYRDAALVRPYVAVRENEFALPSKTNGVTVKYKLCHDELSSTEGKIVYRARGVMIARPTPGE